MNIEKIFKALEEDSDNSALGIICQELEQQGYSVSMNGKHVSSTAIFDGEYPDLETLMKINVSLMRKKKKEQSFVIEFLEFHEMVIKRGNEE